MKNRTVNETPDPLNAENPPQIPHSNPTTNCFESYWKLTQAYDFDIECKRKSNFQSINGNFPT